MEIELKSLLDKIKKEGVDEAQKGADKIIKDAKDKAAAIIKDAESQKVRIIDEGKARAQGFRASSEKAVKQAARDVILSLRERVGDFFHRVIKEKVSDELGTDVLKEAILKAVQNFHRDGVLDIEVLVNEDERSKVEKLLFRSLSQEAKKRLTIKGAKGIEKGFRIGVKGKDSYIDFTDEAIAESLKQYLNPKLVEVLDINLGLDKE